MFIKRFITTLVMAGVFGFITNCTSGGGDPKVTPPPPATYTVTLIPSQGITASPTLLTGNSGDTRVSSITLPTGYTNPVASPANGTFSNGVTIGTFNFSVVIGNANATITISATAPVPLYSISGKVTNVIFGATVTLSTGKSVTTDENNSYTFTGVPTGNYIVNISMYGWVFNPSFRNVGVNNADSTGNDFTATLANPTVEMGINVFYKDSTGSGTTSCLVVSESIYPKFLGTTRTLTASVQKPSESNFTVLLSGTVGSDVSGYMSMQLYYGDGFYDTLTDGTKRYWASGIATFKLEITTETGVRTSVIAKVGVLMGYIIFGPLQQAVVSSDGKSIQLVGSFPSAPVAHLYKFIPFPIRLAWTLVPNNFIVTVPAGFSSTDSRLVVISGYPNAECSTVFVNIPAPQ